MKCKLIVILALVATVLTFALESRNAFADDSTLSPASSLASSPSPSTTTDANNDAREPASQRRPLPTATPRAGDENPEYRDGYQEPYRRDLPRDIYIPKFQYTAMLGVGFNSSDDLSNDVYQHQIWRSPVALAGFHYAFFRQRHFNMLVGADAIYIRSTDVASSSRATATYSSDNWDGGVTIGVGWRPGAPDSKFQVQAKFGTGLNLSHTATLQSPGFTTSIDSQNSSSILAFWAEASAVYLPTPNWRILGTVLAVAKTDALLGGVAYAY